MQDYDIIHLYQPNPKQIMKKELIRLDALITKFRDIANQFPQGRYGELTAKLETERAELVSKIGRRKGEKYVTS